ncbi:L,D-transpeptidase family protein [bacterium]|nr:L,D-transpeptidase family protein [bacterium]
MSSILRVLIFLSLLLPALAQSPLPDSCQQLVLVIAPDWDSPKASLERFERSANGAWKAVGQPIPVILGRSGLGWGLGEHIPTGDGPAKKEGDNKAPAGIFAITQLWLRPGIAAPVAGGYPAQIIQADTIAVDDPNSRLYNRIIRTSTTPNPDWKSWEKMDIPDYDRVLVVAHNLAQPKPRQGSCIFIHRWEDSETPTSGCTAMDESHMVQLINWLRPERKPRLVQLPQALARQWQQQGWIPSANSR